MKTAVPGKRIFIEPAVDGIIVYRTINAIGSDRMSYSDYLTDVLELLKISRRTPLSGNAACYPQRKIFQEFIFEIGIGEQRVGECNIISILGLHNGVHPQVDKEVMLGSNGILGKCKIGRGVAGKRPVPPGAVKSIR